MTEKQWLALWGALAGAVSTAEIVALRTKAPHAPLSYFLRQMPGGGHPLGQAAFVWAAWRFHRHLWPPRCR